MTKISPLFCFFLAFLIQQNQLSAQDKFQDKILPKSKTSAKTPAKTPAETVAKKDAEALNQNVKVIAAKPISAPQVLITGFADIVEDLIPAVVNISVFQELQNNADIIEQILPGELEKNPLSEDFLSQIKNYLHDKQDKAEKVSAIGSGFVISEDGFIVTNNHVIEGGSNIEVNLNNGLKYKAKIVAIDKKTDLALLKINPENKLKFVKFGDSNKTRIGDWVIIIGNPYGLGGSVSVGIVSARSRDIDNSKSEDFIQTDAAINRGNSGGPMFNLNGEVIGVSSAIFSPSGANIGIGFARPSATAAEIIRQLRENGEVMRGSIGVSVQDIPEEIAKSIKTDNFKNNSGDNSGDNPGDNPKNNTKGAFVIEVVKNGPAEKAGILPSDVIVKFNDEEITGMKILPKIVSRYQAGKLAKITILRHGEIKNLTVKIGKMQNAEEETQNPKNLKKRQKIKPVISISILGLDLAQLNNEIRKNYNIAENITGLLVIKINPKSEAAQKEILAGDLLLSVNQKPLKSIADLEEIIIRTKKSANKKLFFLVKRNDANYPVVLILK
jgi:serine protease Do